MTLKTELWEVSKGLGITVLFFVVLVMSLVVKCEAVLKRVLNI